MKRLLSILSCALTCALLLTLAGCDSSDTPGPGPEPEPEKKPPFTIALSGLEARSVTVTVTPDDPDLPYCAGPMTEAEYAACNGDVAEHVASLIRKAQQAEPMLAIEELVARLRRMGTTTQTYSGFMPQTKYYVTAIGLGDDGLCTTEAAIESFTTPELVLPEGRFTITTTEIAQTGVTVSVTPEDDTLPYYFDVITAEDYAGCGGDLSVIMSELLDFILAQNPGRSIEEITAVLQSRGPDSDRLENLPPSSDFYAFAIGLGDDGSCLTRAVVTPFRTLDPGNPADCTFRIAVTNNDSQSVFVEVTPSDGTVGYFTMAIEESDFAGDANLTARIRQAIEQLAGEQQMSVERAVETICWRGTSRELQDGLTPSTDYYAVAYALKADASAAGPVTKERFTTLGENTSTATCDLILDKYYDGDALHALDPQQYADLAGKVYVPVTARPSSNAVHWYTALGRGDMTDPAFYPDETTINALIQGGTADKREMNYVADWGDATLLAVAADAYYQFGAVYRQLVTFTREGASPATDLVPAASEAAMQLHIAEAQPTSRPEARVQATLARRIRAAAQAAPATFRRLAPHSR